MQDIEWNDNSYAPSPTGSIVHLGADGKMLKVKEIQEVSEDFSNSKSFSKRTSNLFLMDYSNIDHVVQEFQADRGFVCTEVGKDTGFQASSNA